MDQTYDYIVIGAGSGGCPVANRLSADPRNRVLLLEAGPKDRNIWIHIPIGYYKNMTSPLSWGYSTEPEKGLNNRSIIWPRGKVLGGSSAINGLLYVRGQREDYDHWRQLGNEGWSYEEVLPFFKKAENQENGSNEYHGRGGPLQVSNIRDKREICDAFIKAALQAGIPFNEDFNGAFQEGVGTYQTTSVNGRRCSSAVGYLRPIQGRRNLRIDTNAHVMNLEFEGTKVSSVRYHKDGNIHTVKVAGEVVLAGGAINSPQLLQLSGVGPGDLLKSHGIKVVHNSPGVGADLQDHYQARAIVELNKPISVNDDVNNLLRWAWAGVQYALFRRGPATFSAGHVGVFTRVLNSSATPDAQIHFIPFSATSMGGSLHPFSGVTISVCQLRPESRGQVIIKSGDPFAHPKIIPNYLSTDYDQRIMIEGLKLVRRIVSQSAFSKYVIKEHEPGSEKVSDAALLDYAKEKGNTIFHPTSTCRMGTDPKAVVDTRLRVRGVQGVRIADCSIMPTVISGNTNAPAIMVGEKCAHMILEESA